MQGTHEEHLTRQQAVLAMCQRSLDMFDSADTALDNKLMGLIGQATLLLALASMAASQAAHAWPRAVVAVLIGLSFWKLAQMLTVALEAWKPARYSTPGLTQGGIQGLKDRYLDTETPIMLARMISDHAGDNGAIRQRRESTVRKGATVERSVLLFRQQVALLAIAMCISLVSYAVGRPGQEFEPSATAAPASQATASHGTQIPATSPMMPAP